MEIIATHAEAYPKTCLGCIENKREIMLSFMAERGAIHDVFLTSEQAHRLIARIQEELCRNKYLSTEASGRAEGGGT